jgi:DNA polymerase-3 subunit delta'
MNIVGHKKIIDYLEKSVQRDSLHHAYLFTGPEHVGKFTVAMNWAERILGNVSQTNADLIIVRPEIEEKNGVTKKKAIGIENISELQRKIITTATNGKYKIVIIDEAERLNVSAQNALLKTLEEPPENVILILISQNNEKLLPTILSRCQIKKFNPVSPKEISDIVVSCGDARGEILFWSLGRPGLAKIFSQDEAAILERKESCRELQGMLAKDVNEKFILAENWSKNTTSIIEKLNWWMIMIRENLLGNSQEIRISKIKALKMAEKINESIDILKNTNSNPRLVLENLMLEF